MPEIPPEAIMAAATAIERELLSGRDYSMAQDSDEALARVALEAAAPILAEAVAQKILTHMEGFGPRKPAGALEPVSSTGRDYRAWRRHFGIAARIAAGAFYTREDELRLAAEAIGRGEFIGCNIPEVPSEH
jgi:hypothetical protein